MIFENTTLNAFKVDTSWKWNFIIALLIFDCKFFNLWIFFPHLQYSVHDDDQKYEFMTYMFTA